MDAHYAVQTTSFRKGCSTMEHTAARTVGVGKYSAAESAAEIFE